MALNHDDILVGYRGKTFWYEIKSDNQMKKDGTLKANALKASQVKLQQEWKGHYRIVTGVDEILKELEIFL